MHSNYYCLDLGRIAGSDLADDSHAHAHDEHDGGGVLHDDIDDNWFSRTDYQHMQKLGNLSTLSNSHIIILFN